MKILAIETSTKILGLAIADEDSILAEYKGDQELKHSQDIIPNIALLLKKIDSNLSDIDGLAISIGPGSFTGLRVGVSILKGLNLATNIPIVSVPTLDVIAYNARDISSHICVIVDAKKNNLYASLYKVKNDDIIRLWDYLLVSADEVVERVQKPEYSDRRESRAPCLPAGRKSRENQKMEKDILFLGDGLILYGNFISERLKEARLADRKFWFPDVKIVARLGIKKYKNREFEDPDTLMPMYIYSRECNINKART